MPCIGYYGQVAAPVKGRGFRSIGSPYGLAEMLAWGRPDSAPIISTKAGRVCAGGRRRCGRSSKSGRLPMREVLKPMAFRAGDGSLAEKISARVIRGRCLASRAMSSMSVSAGPILARVGLFRIQTGRGLSVYGENWGRGLFGTGCQLRSWGRNDGKSGH